MPNASVSAVYRGVGLWCGMPVTDMVSGWPAATGVPGAAMKVSPCAATSRCSVSCGEASFVSPTFFTMTREIFERRGKTLCDVQRARGRVDLSPNLNERAAWWKRTADDHPRTIHAGQR